MLLFVYQVNKCGREVTAESMLDSLQIGWSTALCSIIDHFLSSLLKTRTSRSDSAASAFGFQNQLNGISDTTSETETKVLNLVPSTVSQSAGSSESSDRRKELILLLKNTDANVQCTNINVFMCHEQTGKRFSLYCVKFHLDLCHLRNTFCSHTN